MTRTLKALGVAMVAAFALSAVAAAAAQAEPLFTSEGYPATITATAENAIGSEGEFFESVGRKLECEEATFTGELTGASSTFTVTPNYIDHEEGGNCRAEGVLVVTVTENGCAYIFHKAEFTAGPNDYDVYVEIECPEGNQIEVHIRNLFNTANACTVTVAAQTAGGSLTATNTGNGTIDLEGTVTVNSTIHSSNTTLCGIPSGTSEEVVTNYVVNNPLEASGNNGAISISGE